MNLDELQTAQSRERQTDSLQQLRESFYEDAGQFISQLREERQRAAERADDPFDAPEVRRLSDDIKTAERTVEAIYERRIGKLVKQASLEAAGMAADASGLTREEADVFETLVATIERNREHVLDEVIAGEVRDGSTSGPVGETGDGAPEATGSSEPSPADRPRDDADATAGPPTDEDAAGVDAADLMGGDGASAPESPSTTEVAPERADADDDGPAIPPDTPLDNEGPEPTDPDAPHVAADTSDDRVGGPAGDEPTGDEPTGDEPTGDEPTGDGATGDHAGGSAGGSADDPSSDAAGGSVDRTTVRITRDVGEILGVDQRAYDLSREDVVTLPTPNADPLVDRDAAERLD
jgi:DNA replication factor GINS